MHMRTPSKQSRIASNRILITVSSFSRECRQLNLNFHLNSFRFRISHFSQMALDGKAIKEEIPDKEVYDSGSVRRTKGEWLAERLIN